MAGKHRKGSLAFARAARSNPGLKQGQGYLKTQLKHLRELRRTLPRGSDDHRKLGEMVDLLKDRLKRAQPGQRNNPDRRGWSGDMGRAYNAGLDIGKKAKADGFDPVDVLARGMIDPPAGAPRSFLASFVQGIQHGLQVQTKVGQFWSFSRLPTTLEGAKRRVQQALR